MLIAAQAHLGRIAEARRELAAYLALFPGTTLMELSRGLTARDRRRVDVLIEGMRLAGMPEGSDQ
jgi:hypothetical protein